jgi:succinate dehydrogenase / fumarate reductase membrane anchor subunit
VSRGATGLRAWVLQRITALYLGLFWLYLLAHFLIEPPAGFSQWRAWVSRPEVAVGLLMGVLALLLHAWVGVRDVLIDYVRSSGTRIALLGLLGTGLVACGLWFLRVILLARVV